MIPLAAEVISRPIGIDGSYNARLVGSGNALLRTAALDTLSADGAETLRSLGITRIVDLREDSEVPAGLGGAGIDVLRIPLYRLPDGPPMSGTLEQVYDLLLETRGAELSAAVAAIADAPGPVLVHCTAGKDRTGLVVALALSAAGIPREAIVEDYALSGPEVRRHRLAPVQAILEDLVLDAAAQQDALRLHLDSPPAAIGHVLDRLAAGGGAAGYLVRHGLNSVQLDRLRQRVLS